MPNRTHQRKAAANHSSPSKRSFENKRFIQFHPKVNVRWQGSEACFDSLPEELVLRIFRCAAKGALYNACMVNKKFNRIGTEVLYQDCNNYDGSMDAVLDCAKLQFIKHLEYEMGGYSFDDVFLERILAGAVNIRSLWVTESATLVPYMDGKNPKWMTMVTNAILHGRGPMLQGARFEHLREFNVVVCSDLGFSDFSIILTLPSLRRFVLDGAAEPSPARRSPWTCPESTSNVIEIELSRCFSDSVVIAQLLSSCKALKSFSYSYDSSLWCPLAPDHNVYAHWAIHSWPVIQKALEKHNDSLETLSLGCFMDEELLEAVFDEDIGLYDHQPLSLSKMSNLQHLTTQVDTLARTYEEIKNLGECLPVALQTLKIWIVGEDAVDGWSIAWEPHYSVLKALYEAIEHKHLPKLRQIEIECLTELENDNFFELVDSAQSFEKIGIEVKVRGEEVNIQEIRRLESQLRKPDENGGVEHDNDDKEEEE